MVNRFLGEASTDLDGATYTLRMDFNAMCEFEDATGKDAMETLATFEGGKVSALDLRALIWAMLKRHHPDVSAQVAGDILSADSGVLQRVLVAAMPTAEEAMGNAHRRGKSPA